MSSLERFFAEQAKFYESAADPAAAARGLASAFPAWAHRQERVALYAEFAVNNIRNLLGQLYPATRDALPAATWEGLVTGYYATRPGRASFEIGENGRAFAAFVDERRDLPAFVPALVRFEWMVQEVYTSKVEVPAKVEVLSVNPTLEVLQHPWALVSYLVPRPPRPDPVRQDETAIFWRNRETQLVHWMQANARTLLAIKLAGEGIDPAEAARAGGVPLDSVQAAIADHVKYGVLLAT